MKYRQMYPLTRRTENEWREYFRIAHDDYQEDRHRIGVAFFYVELLALLVFFLIFYKG